MDTLNVTPTYWQFVTAAATEQPAAPVVSDDHGRSLTRSDLVAAAEGVAAALARRGVGPGTVVSWQLPTTVEAVVLLVALTRLGAVQNPLFPTLRQREVAFITRQAGTELFIVPETWRGFDHGRLAADLAADSHFDVLQLDLQSAAGEHRLPTADPSSLPPAPTGDGARWVYYTSGTTADPKGARHCDTTLIASSNAQVEQVGFDRRDVYPIAWPFAHIGGVSMLATSLRTGTHLVLFDAFDPEQTPRRMAAHRPTALGTAVPFFRAFLAAQQAHGDRPLFPHLRFGCFGGAPVPAEIHAEVQSVLGVPLVGMWGLTEFPVATAATLADDAGTRATSVGRPARGVTVRVVGADGEECPPGTEGELRLKGPQCFLGYVDQRLDGEAFDQQGWLCTGDLGTVDTGGVVRITGRLKDIVIRNAENISVVEIEELLFAHPDVSDAAVLGVPDERTGERVVAVVVPRAGAALQLDDLRAHCRAHGLATYKCPEQLEVTEVLPRNTMGKVLKHELRAGLLSRP